MSSFSFGELPMKQLILAAIAATFVFASAAQAAAPANDPAANAMTVMGEVECATEMVKCKDAKDPQACKDALVKDHSCKAEG
jgi:hypothetical protein